MRIATILSSVLFTMLIISAPGALAEDEVYRWVDENGVVHFGANAEAHKDAEKVDLQADMTSGIGVNPAPGSTDPGLTNQGQQAEPSLAQQRRDERAANYRAATQKHAEIAATCERARQRVAKLEPSPQVLVQAEDGSVERLDDNKRLEILAESKTYIAKNCQK